LEEKQDLLAALNVLKGIVACGLAKLMEDLTGELPEEEKNGWMNIIRATIVFTACGHSSYVPRARTYRQENGFSTVQVVQVC
jgi:hypothetical protein